MNVMKRLPWFRPFLMGDFIFEVTSRAFLALKLVIAPSKEKIEPALLGMSLTTLGEVPRSVFRSSRVAIARIFLSLPGNNLEA